MENIKNVFEKNGNIKIALSIIIAVVAGLSVFGMGKRFGEFLFFLLH